MKLYRLTNKIGDYWVIANDPTEAEQKLKKVLDAGEGYGFSNDRNVTEFHLIAEQIEGPPFGLTNKYLLV